MTEQRPNASEPSGGVLVHEYLQTLTDDELDAYIDHYLRRYEASRGVPGEGFQAWWLSKIASGGLAEARRRR